MALDGTQYWTTEDGTGDSVDGYSVSPRVGSIVQLTTQVNYDDMTDGGSTAGTLATTLDIPAGSVVLASRVDVVEGFTGDTSATMTVGDGSDADRYGSFDVFTGDVTKYDTPVGTADNAAKVDITVTVTSDSDFSDVEAGRAIITLVVLEG